MATQHHRLEIAMKNANRSWDDIRAFLKLTRAGIKKWRDGNFKELTAANIFALAEYLACDPRWLATGKKTADGEESGVSALLTTWNLVNDEGRQEMVRHAEYVASQDRFRSREAANGGPFRA